MIKSFIIQDDFVWVDSLNQKTYRIYFESADKRRWYEASNSQGALLDILKETFFCGNDHFFRVPSTVLNRGFEIKLGRFLKISAFF